MQLAFNTYWVHSKQHSCVIASSWCMPALTALSYVEPVCIVMPYVHANGLAKPYVWYEPHGYLFIILQAIVYIISHIHACNYQTGRDVNSCLPLEASQCSYSLCTLCLKASTIYSISNSRVLWLHQVSNDTRGTGTARSNRCHQSFIRVSQLNHRWRYQGSGTVNIEWAWVELKISWTSCSGLKSIRPMKATLNFSWTIE